VADGIVSAFRHVWPDSWGARVYDDVAGELAVEEGFQVEVEVWFSTPSV
jgi:hypothetical protein